jgi:hypothetical protein
LDNRENLPLRLLITLIVKKELPILWGKLLCLGEVLDIDIAPKISF